MARQLSIPVVFLVFNRPELTARVFERIRAARPSQLIVVADGPRPGRSGDAERCRSVRGLIERGVTWPCEVVRDYATENLGCGRRVASGLDRAFDRVESAIVLEDDCLPDPTFFPYCAELLERYGDDRRIGLVCGANHLPAARAGSDSYYFCRYGNIWGWATWRRAWRCFDRAMADWPAWRDGGGLATLFPNAAVRAFWREVWNDSASGRIDSWDYQWTYSYMRAGLLGILPRAPLIENIGFGARATHTFGAAPVAAPVEPMSFPLKHAAAVQPDFDAEACASARFFVRRSITRRIVERLHRFLAR